MGTWHPQRSRQVAAPTARGREPRAAASRALGLARPAAHRSKHFQYKELYKNRNGSWGFQSVSSQASLEVSEKCDLSVISHIPLK